MAGTVLAVLDAAGGARLADPAEPVVRADDLAVIRGEAVFETLRVQDARPFLLDRHLRRLAGSAERVAVPLCSGSGWRALVRTALDAYGAGPGMMRLVCTKGPEDGRGHGLAFALVSPIPPAVVAGRDNGVSAITLTLGVPAELRSAAPWLLGGVKSTSYAVAMAALRAAAAAGAAEAVWVSADGEVLEAPTSTVVLVRGGELLTPPAVEVGILPGTTLAAVSTLAGGITERRVTLEDLRSADEAMLLSSVRGVAPMLRLDRRPIATGGVGPITDRLRAGFEAAVQRGGL